MRDQGGKELWLAALRADGPALRAAVAEADPATSVPSRPEWTVGRLVGHLVGYYTWVGSHVRRGVITPPDEPHPHGPDTAGLAEFDDAYAALLTCFDGLDPEMPAWNWAPQAKKAAFWIRRIAHDTALHRWDAQMAAVGLTEPIEAKLAADGVSEVLDMLLPAGRGHRSADRHGMVALSATDLEHTWHIRLRANGGVALLDTDTLLDEHDLHERVVAEGNASDLQLALWGRVGFDVLVVTGEEALLECLRVG
jgi:uncharacterized protein (TIGR03083 family)